MFDYDVYVPKVEWNSATHLNHATRTVYLLGSQFKLPHGASSLDQMLLLGHANIKQCCEIQWEKRLNSVKNTIFFSYK